MNKKYRYTPIQIKFLRTKYMSLPVRDITPAFNKKFHTHKTDSQIRAALKNHKIKCGRKHGERIYPCRLYNKKEAQFLRDNYAGRDVVELTALFNHRFNRNMTRQQIRSFVHNRGIVCGLSTRFEKGQVSWNKGLKGFMGANITSFKKGNIPKNQKSLGAERIDSKDGFILKKIAERNPYTCALTRYKHKHVWIWEQQHGLAPAGMVVVFKDGNRRNCEPDNLMLISRHELLVLNKNHYNEMPTELKPSVLALSKLEVRIAEKNRRQKNNFERD